MKFKRRVREEPTINLTALIDVVFLLLIFFMVTTTFTQETRLAVNLPEADGEAAQEASDQIEVLISRTGEYSINGRQLVDTQLSTLMSGLEEVAQGNRSLPVLLIADAETSHQSVVTAMDAIGQSGFSRLSIGTRRPEEGAGIDAGAVESE